MPNNQESPSVQPVAHGHLRALDGVRGLAILMVILSHAFEANYQTAGPVARFVGWLFHYGLFGVDLFFVLSGFLITGILFDSLHDDGFFRKFYARRTLRIFPLYYFILIIILLLTVPLHLHWGDMGWLLALYLQNLHPYTISNFSPGAGIGLYHFWSLAVEEQFYLVWPAIVFYVRGKRALLLTTLIGSVAALLLRIGLLAAGATSLAIHVTTICRADSLLLGCALAIFYRSNMWGHVKQIAPLGFIGAAATIIGSIVLLDPYLVGHPLLGRFWIDGLRYSVLGFCFTCLIAWSLRPQSACEWFFKRGWLCFLGKYSYGIYVLHVLALSIISLPLRAFVLHRLHNKALAVVVAGVVSLVVGIMAAYLSFHWYEKPFLRLKHRFDYRRKSLNYSSPQDG